MHIEELAPSPVAQLALPDRGPHDVGEQDGGKGAPDFHGMADPGEEVLDAIYDEVPRLPVQRPIRARQFQ